MRLKPEIAIDLESAEDKRKRMREEERQRLYEQVARDIEKDKLKKKALIAMFGLSTLLAPAWWLFTRGEEVGGQDEKMGQLKEKEGGRSPVGEIATANSATGKHLPRDVQYKLTRLLAEAGEKITAPEPSEKEQKILAEAQSQRLLDRQYRAVKDAEENLGGLLDMQMPPRSEIIDWDKISQVLAKFDGELDEALEMKDKLSGHGLFPWESIYQNRIDDIQQLLADHKLEDARERLEVMMIVLAIDKRDFIERGATVSAEEAAYPY